MTLVRVYTDASIKLGRGAWATVILREGEAPVEFSGALRGTFHSSTATELCAVANAITKATAEELIGAGDHAIVYCDNDAAVLRLNGHARTKASTDPLLVKAAGVATGLAKGRGFTLKAKHVKGHQAMATVCAHGVYNLRCDELCSAIRDNVEAATFAALLVRIDREKANLAKRQAKAAAAAAAGAVSGVERALRILDAAKRAAS